MANSEADPRAKSLPELLNESELAVRRRNQEALTGLIDRREEFYQSVLDSLAEGLLITNAESRIIYVNRGLSEITGFSREELVGRVSYEMLSPEKNWPAMRRRLRERLAGKVETYEHELRVKDGSLHWVSVKATPYRNSRCDILGTIGAITCLERQKSLERQNEYLLNEIREDREPVRLIGQSAPLQKVLDQIQLVGPTEATVLILGESGSGKELVARALHEASRRREQPLVRVNCASIPKELFESEFFGHVKGAFTGAVKDRLGRFQLADHGTLFLDEIGEIPLDLQGKLLRVLQEGQFEKVGEDRTRTVDVRVIAATNRDLAAEARAGHFREDLYYRLSVFPVTLPPLRERRADIAPLARHFLFQTARRLGVTVPELPAEQLQILERYSWPGNIRELENVVERAVILSRNRPLSFDLPTLNETRVAMDGGEQTTGETDELSVPRTLADLKRLERELFLRALERAKGRIYGSGGAAESLGIKPTTLISRLGKMGIVAGARQWSETK
ncbi:MAG TPA: sigma 54-interacting transcriptional regulator [Verrucomicrobiae bacterium]|nr:sigma 54-interacting transcriptional regulator [Verrucomicrobiae bacterium]